ncbi:unnamed protein product [[Actinomadura] parvosata subsp. kistnae]|nr:unnamed protein product [Actinomadura parvosata subsp. kistnae]
MAAVLRGAAASVGDGPPRYRCPRCGCPRGWPSPRGAAAPGSGRSPRCGCPVGG